MKLYYVHKMPTKGPGDSQISYVTFDRKAAYRNAIYVFDNLCKNTIIWGFREPGFPGYEYEIECINIKDEELSLIADDDEGETVDDVKALPAEKLFDKYIDSAEIEYIDSDTIAVVSATGRCNNYTISIAVERYDVARDKDAEALKDIRFLESEYPEDKYNLIFEY